MSSSFFPQAPLPGHDMLLPASNPPNVLDDSEHIGWSGASYANLLMAPNGQVDHQHSAISLQRLGTPLQARRIGKRNWQTVIPGMRLSLPSEEYHFEWESGGPAALQLLFIAPQQAEYVLERRFDPATFSLWAGGVIDANRIALLINALQQDLAQGCPAGRLVGDSLIAALVAHLSVKPGSSEVSDSYYGGTRRCTLSSALRQTVLEYVEVNLATPPSLADLASLARMSPRHFCRVFQASLGMPPHQYLLHLRVEKAKELLRHSPHSSADIALQLGFADQSQFSNTFKRFVGTSPSRYRTESRR